MIQKILIRTAAAVASLLFLALPASAEQIEVRGVAQTNPLTYSVRFKAGNAVNDFTDAIPSCTNMTVYWERGNSAVVSVYPADSDDDTVAEVEANSAIHQFTANEVYGPFTPTKAYVRFVVDTANASIASSAKVICSHLAGSGTGGGVTETAAANLPVTGDSSKIYRITDATNGGDCDNVGGGTEQADCRWNGSTYEPTSSGVSGIAAVLDDTSPQLGGDLDANGNDIDPAKNIGRIRYASAYSSGSSTGGIQEAIDACGSGSTLDDQGCQIILPAGTIDVSAKITIGGAPIAANMQNGISLIGHGAGIESNLGDKLAGTTLRWTGANGGTVLEVHGFNHHLADFMVHGNNEAGYGIVQVGENATGDVTGKNVYERITIKNVLDTTNASTGWAFAFGTSDLGQNDHTVLTQVRALNNRHCLLALDTQGVMNTVNTFDCADFTVSPGIKLVRGSIKFNDLYLGTSTASAVGVQVDPCFTSFEVDTGAVEWQGDNGTIFRFANRNADGCNSYGNGYVSAIRNVRVLLQTAATTEHTCVEHSVKSDLILEGNMWTSALHAQTCDFEFDNPDTNGNSYITWAGNRVGWESGYYKDDPSITLTASGGQNKFITFIYDGLIKLKDKNGTASLVKDSTGLFADNNADGDYDAGTDLRFDPSLLGDISAVGGCASGACWTAATSGINDSNGVFSTGAFNVYLDDDESTTATTSFTVKEVSGGVGSNRFTVREDGQVTYFAEQYADALGIEFEPGDALTNCSTFAATGGGIFYDDSEGKLKKCQDNTLSDLDTGGGGMAADSLWAAAGDLAYGSANDTGAILSIGSAGQVLRVSGGLPSWGDFDIDFTAGDTSDDDDLDVAAGGTGASSFTSNAILKGAGTGDLVASGVSIDSSNNVTGMGTLTTSGAITAPYFVTSDYTTEPGNLLSINDNDTAFANDPTCANSGVAGTVTIIDKDESATDDYVVCDGTTELGSFNQFPELDQAETITGNWVNTANPWADNEVADTITASNYLPLAGGTITGNVVIDSGATVRPSGTGVVEATEVDASAGAAPTANGAILYDSTANDLEYGDNGTNRKVANLDEAQTLSSKTLASPTISGTMAGANTIPSSLITTERRTLNFSVDEMEVDGTNCVKNAAAVVNSGPKIQTITCADNDASTIYGSVKMPDGWDTTSTISFQIHGFSVNAADSGDLNADFTASCRGQGDTIDSTWATEVAIDTLGGLAGLQYGVDIQSSASITPNGGCAAGDMLFWRYQIDAAGTTASMTEYRFIHGRVEFVTNVGD